VWFLYGTAISTEVSFVLLQFTRLIDEQTEGNLVAYTALRSMQRGKNEVIAQYQSPITIQLSKI